MLLKNKHDMTKDRILNEAETLFAQKGFHGVTVIDISLENDAIHFRSDFG